MATAKKSQVEIKTRSGDIERQILHQSILAEPDSDEDGGRNTWKQNCDDFDASWDDEEEENVGYGCPEPSGRKEIWADVLTRVRSKHNTGPKGVKADYEEAKVIIRCRQEKKALMDSERLKALTEGNLPDYGQESYSYTAQIESMKKARNQNQDHDDCSSAEEDDDEDSFLKNYRRRRMHENAQHREHPQFGKVISVTKFSFLDELECADPRTMVITHIYEDYILSCKRMNLILDHFASKHKHVKVLKLLASEASHTLSNRCLPAFLVYKNKQMVNECSIGLDERSFGKKNFDLNDLEILLTVRYSFVLPGVNVTERERREVDRHVENMEDTVLGNGLITNLRTFSTRFDS